MLKHLSITNYALIDSLSLDFEKGLTTVTGETGAGKSILLGALRLVLGERADLKSLNNQDKKCVVEAIFDVSKLELKTFFEENALDYEEESILRREILPSGKSRAFINDMPTTLKVVEKLRGYLIDIHSQFQTADLFTNKFRFEWIDAVAENGSILSEYNLLLDKYKEQSRSLEQMIAQKKAWEQEQEYKHFLFQELEDSNLDSINMESLETEQNQLENAEEIGGGLSGASQILEAEEQGILHLLSELQTHIKSFSAYTPIGEQLRERIDSVKIETQDISNEISQQLEELEVNPERLLQVQKKLNMLHTLLQKHQVGEVEQLRQIRDELKAEISQSLTTHRRIEQLKKEIKQREEELETKAEILHKNRKATIPKIQKTILQTLSHLGMPHAQIQFLLVRQKEFGMYGKDGIQLLFSANKGAAPKEIEKAVSGGERSRLMLAVKQNLVLHKNLPTLILDEIDTGVSGKIAGEMGKIMKQMGEYVQLITITHLPQVAALGQQHIKVSKKETEGKMRTQVLPLSPNQRLHEIAQMISGAQITDAAMQQAQELLQN